MDTLAPCPTCGSDKITVWAFEDYMNTNGGRIETPLGPMYIDWCDEFWITYCDGKCQGSTSTEQHPTRAIAIGAWNAGVIMGLDKDDER